MTIERLPEFERDLAWFHKKYRSLPDDLARVCKVIEAYPQGIPGVIVRVTGTGLSTPIYKVRNFRCKSLGKGAHSGIRLIYACPKGTGRTVLCEMYAHATGQRDLDVARLKRHFD